MINQQLNEYLETILDLEQSIIVRENLIKGIKENENKEIQFKPKQIKSNFPNILPPEQYEKIPKVSFIEWIAGFIIVFLATLFIPPIVIDLLFNGNISNFLAIFLIISGSSETCLIF